jgi:hypothetical protein
MDLDLDEILRLEDGAYGPDGSFVRGGPCAVKGTRTFPTPLADGQLTQTIAPDPLEVKGGETVAFTVILTNTTSTPLSVPLSGCMRQPLVSLQPFDAAGRKADDLPVMGGCASDGLCEGWDAVIVLPPGGRAHLRGEYKALLHKLDLSVCKNEPAGSLPAGSYSLRLKAPVHRKLLGPYYGKIPIDPPLVVLPP